MSYKQLKNSNVLTPQNVRTLPLQEPTKQKHLPLISVNPLKQPLSHSESRDELDYLVKRNFITSKVWIKDKNHHEPN